MTEGTQAAELEARLGKKFEALFHLQGEIRELKQQWAMAAAATVEDYRFQTSAGERRLSDLFGDKDDLIVVHNMGKQCSYCTLWADGFVGLLPHILDRTAFVLSSPDSPAVQDAFASSRGWPYQMLSTEGSSFAKDMGYADEEGRVMPGYSTFRRRADGSILRVNKDYFGPGDSYCGVWPFFENLADGADGWQPKFTYDD